ncbi:N-acetylglucosamine kinase [Colwellia sp. E2M01]|uniref:N-acetylglucosamine kinase n=1 Tax=Colwellia sp. E2M01 TaxID=2841561 RepID=UPI001C0A326C|nr:BadF/BadG/BcrA/BcrD ATPase family protein [Colwellia sp. E2M01]MBU2869221.1 ATPase [Colwellia sp. E2M01]
MLTSNNKNNDLFIGIDGGGSKSKAIIMNKDNEILGTGISGPGNPLHGFEQATHSIIESAKLALEDAGLAHMKLDEFVAGVGLAGVNIPVLFDQMAAWQHPFKNMHLATDLLIACLGAHNGGDGAVIISGTGSCGFSCQNNEQRIVGAHGFPHGDKGSGAWFGLQAVKQVLLSLDGLVKPTLMSAALLTKLNCSNDTALVEVVAGKKATFFGQQAHIVFDAANLGDEIALTILNEGAEYLNNMVRTLTKDNSLPISMLGGLTPILKQWLAVDIQADLKLPLHPPEVGSVIYAREQESKMLINI